MLSLVCLLSLFVRHVRAFCHPHDVHRAQLAILLDESAAVHKKVIGRPCTTLLGWCRNQWGALLGVLRVKANCELFDNMVLFSGRAGVVHHDYGLYHYYIPTLSADYFLCPSPRLSILYRGICDNRVEEIQNCLVVSFILSYICESI